MKRILILALALSSLLVGHSSFAADQPRPNILWLIAEDFGQHLGCFGTKEVWTPHLDKLASDGVLYTRFYDGMVCSVSRSSFMTGMYATSIGAQNHRTKNRQMLPDGVRPLTGWLRDAGYFTANLVQMPESCGFKGAGKTDWNFLTNDKPFDSAKWDDLKTHQPFYAQVNFHETHRTYKAPKKADPAKVEIPPYYPDHPIVRQDWADYLDSATELDLKIGKVLESLKADGLADNTIIVFFGDNGQSHARGKQFCYEEGFLVPLIIRWPKNFPAPAHFTPGTRDARLLDGIDLAPMMLDIAGAAKPPKMQGRIFLGDRCEPDNEYIFGYRDRCDMTVMRIRSVRDTRWRYIRDFTPWVPFLAFNEYKTEQYPVWTLWPKLQAEGKLTPAQQFAVQPTMPEEELYDMDSDPWQLTNLAKSDSPEAKATLTRMRGVLEKWIVDTDDHGRHMETLEELQAADPKFTPARDWRPQPGTPDAAKAEAFRAAAKERPAPRPQPQHPQEPKRPFPYDEEDVQFDNPRAKATLAGTLTHPKGAGPFPAVLLVAGSGPLERDESVAGHRIFLLLSDYLTRRGLAVLRYDKRGVAKSTGDYQQATTLDFADDAVAGMEFLKGRKDIDPKHTGAIGHSEGGTIMPTLAVNWPDTAFIVMLAGVGTTGEENAPQQDRLAGQAGGATEEELTKHEELLKRWFDLSKRGADGSEIERQLLPLLAAQSQGNLMAVAQQLAYYRSPWARFALTHSCLPALEKVRCPVLALNGGKDRQVPPKENLCPIARTLAVSGHTDFVIREMPGLNHLFQHCPTGAGSEYAGIEETMSPEVLQIVGDWIVQHVRQSSQGLH